MPELLLMAKLGCSWSTAYAIFQAMSWGLDAIGIVSLLFLAVGWVRLITAAIKAGIVRWGVTEGCLW